MAYNTYHQSPKKNRNQESVESRIVFSVLKGLAMLVLWPIRALKPAHNPKTRRSQALDTQEVARRWADIQTSVGLGGITHFGQAIVAADKLLDYVLKAKGYEGETMGERLRSAETDIAPAIYQRAWQAHKLRNQLVHEVETEVLSFQAKQAILDYEQVLRELGALR